MVAITAEPQHLIDTPTGFSELGLRPELLRALAELGYEEPTPIQRAAIPPLLEGCDVVGQAATGTGKTAAFALPVLHRIRDGERGERVRGPAGARALILVPTRELAIQVSEAMHSYGRDMSVRVLPVYGGQPIGRQLRALDRGVDVVVATPGRALDHLTGERWTLAALRIVVLDEADEMFDMGFAEDIDAILGGPPTTGRPCCSRPPCRRGSTAWCAATCSDPVRVELGAASRRRRGPLGAADRLRGAPRPQARRPRPRARPGDAGGRGRLLPDQGRGRPAHRDPERPGLPGRGAARRNGPAPARPGHGPPTRAAPPTSSWPPMSPPAVSTSTGSRTW